MASNVHGGTVLLLTCERSSSPNSFHLLIPCGRRKPVSIRTSFHHSIFYHSRSQRCETLFETSATAYSYQSRWFFKFFSQPWSAWKTSSLLSVSWHCLSLHSAWLYRLNINQHRYGNAKKWLPPTARCVWKVPLTHQEGCCSKWQLLRTFTETFSLNVRPWQLLRRTGQRCILFRLHECHVRERDLYHHLGPPRRFGHDNRVSGRSCPSHASRRNVNQRHEPFCFDSQGVLWWGAKLAWPRYRGHPPEACGLSDIRALHGQWRSGRRCHQCGHLRLRRPYTCEFFT